MSDQGKERYSQLLELVENYMKALNSLDEAAYLALFSENCVVNDPYGTAEYLGADGLKRFFQGMTDTWKFFEMRGDKFYPGDGNRLAVRWSVSATSKTGKAVEFNGVSVFFFADDKISGLDAYWHFRSMIQELRS